ncbi:MAG: AraC family transcriptional regulator [Gammaproteobacteria bacterium]|nr:AraC family transcriptional regulator [Gammaproteobacteria bacterium]
MGKNTKNRHKNKINNVLVYIQGNIGRQLTLEKLASISHISPYHFHRIFKAEVGESLNSYVKRIRLEQGAFQLKYTNKLIADIAVACGYQNGESFSKAFKQFFNCSPSSFKHNKVSAIVKQSNAQAQILAKQLPVIQPIDIRILPKEKVIFVRKIGNYKKAAADAWVTLLNYAYKNELMYFDAKQIGITYDSPSITCENNIRYDACLKIEKELQPEGDIGLQYTHGGRYAVFVHQGPYENMCTTYEKIYSSWLPESNEALYNSPSFSLYVNNMNTVKEDELLTEIHIPLE